MKPVAQVVALEPEGPDGHGVNWLAGKKPRPGELLCRASDIEVLRAALHELVSLEDMRLRLRQLHEMGHGTDYDTYHKRLPLAWATARAVLGPNA